jgi:glycosyltransferase involved in cell wall biosynthesis
MRIGLLADRLDRKGRRTGVGAYIEGLVHGIEEIDPSDDFVVFSWGANGGGPPASGGVERRTLAWPRKATAASWTFLGVPRVRDVGGPLDLLHVLVPTVPVPSSAPLVATIHDLMPLKHPQLFATRPRILFAETIRRIRRRARWLIADSEATKRDVVELLSFPEDRVTVIYPGIPVEFSGASAGRRDEVLTRLDLKDQRIVLFIGVITRHKNVRLLVEGFAEVLRSVPDARLLLAGSPGMGAPDVVETVRRLGLADAVRFLGHVSQDLADALVCAADVLVVPSLDEGFGFPALEAMSVGTAVVTSSAGSLPEVVADAGLLFPATDAEALSDALTRVLTDDALKDELSRRGIERAATFSWTRTAMKTIEVYGNAIRP